MNVNCYIVLMKATNPDDESEFIATSAGCSGATCWMQYFGGLPQDAIQFSMKEEAQNWCNIRNEKNEEFYGDDNPWIFEPEVIFNVV